MKYNPIKPVIEHYIKYRESIRNTMQPTSLKGTIRTLEGFLLSFKFSKTHRRPDDFHRFDVWEYVDRRKGEGIKDSTLKQELGTLRAFWNWMTERELASYNPFSGIDLSIQREERSGVEV